MSHFAIFVFGGDVDGQLAPYQEYDGEPNGNQIEIDITDRVRESAKEQKITAVSCAEEYYDLAPLREGEKPDFCGEHSNGYYVKGKNGRLLKAISYDTENPKWDWYQIGGRWSGFLLLKNGERADRAKLADVDFAEMKKIAEGKAAETWDALKEIFDAHPCRSWDDVRESAPSVDEARKIYHEQEGVKLIGEKFGPFAFWGSDPFKVASQPREEYIRVTGAASILPYAAVKDGKWLEKGEMGWFGMSSNEMDENEWIDIVEKLIAESDPSDEITVVDCHI